MLPTPISWIRKLLKILKSNLSPNQIAFSVILGIFAGLPPMGLHIIIPATLALLVRGSFRAFLLSMGLFKLISLAVAPGSYAVGRWCLDSSRGLDAFWRWVFHLPVLAPMGYGRYLLFGSLILSLCIAVPTFFLARALVLRYRDTFAAWVSAWSVSRSLRGRRGVGLARWLLVGGGAKYVTVAPPRGIFRFIRREMLIVLPIVYAICYLLAALIVPFFAGSIATSTASWVMGSEVAVQDSTFSLFTGGLVLTDLTVQDPKAPDENLLEAPRLTLNAGMLPLLSRRVVFNRIEIADASLHVVREPDGTLNIDNATSGWNVDGYLEWAAEHAHKVDWLELLQRFVQYLSELRPLEPRGDPYAPYRGGRSFEAYRPPFSVERIEIGRVLISLEDELEPGDASLLPPITLLEIELSNLAYPADLRTEPILVRLRGQWGDDPDSGFEVSARFDNVERTYEVAIQRLDLARLARLYATTLPASIESGRLSLTGVLRQDGATSSGDVSFLLEELQLRGDPQRPLFGLPPQTSQEVIAGINQYAAELPVVFGSSIEGTANHPSIAWEAPLLEIAREGLMIAGRRELESTILALGDRIAELGGVEPGPIAPSYEALRDETAIAARRIIDNTAGELAPGLLDTLPGTEASEPGEEASGGALTDLLEGLFRDLSGASQRDDSETEAP